MTNPIRRPRYDPRIEIPHAALLDALTSIMGYAPDSINVRPVPMRRGETRGGTITITDPKDEDALMHELGHFWAGRAGATSMEAADSLHFDPTTQRGNERIANAYASLLRTRNDTTQTSN